jgi:5-methylphenazine-1-carboxylate 1-monooxygenase
LSRPDIANFGKSSIQAVPTAADVVDENVDAAHERTCAGGGIGGLATALTLHQIGVPCVVFEAVREMRPLGVGINLQPNAVRELYDLGIAAADLDRVGLPAKEWALVGLNGNDIYSEPRGLLAGYAGLSTPCIAASSTCCCYDKVVERIGRRTRCGSAAA